VDEAFGVNPAQRMDADAELAGKSGMPVVIPSLNHISEPLTPPPAQKFAPVTHVSS
jgi:hypothetical protein